MAKPVILTFTDWYLPGYKAGGPVRSLANLTAHTNEHFHYRIVTRNTDYLSNKGYPGVPANTWVQRNSGVEVFYMSPTHIKPSAIATIIRENPADLVYINGIYSLFFSILPAIYARSMNKPTLIAPRGMLSDQAFSAKKAKKKVFLKAARLLSIYKKAHFHATLPREKEDIAAQTGVSPSRIHVAPNLFRPVYNKELPKRNKTPGELHMVSIARIAPEKNTLYALQRLQEIPPEHDVTFHLYGSIYDKAYWNRCKQVMGNLPGHVKAEHKGAVRSDAVPALLSHYHVLWMPSTGENFGHSIMESFMQGVPVLISDRTPWKSLEKDLAGWDFPLEHPEAFTRQIARISGMDQQTYDLWVQGAFNRAKSFMNDPALISKSLSMLYQLSQQPQVAGNAY